MESPNPNKELDSSSTCQNQNHTANSFPNVLGFNQNDVDLIVSSFFSLLDFSSLSSSFSIGCSFDRALEKLFEASTEDDYGKDRLTYRLFELASLIQESAKRCYRKRASLHNSNSWSLPRDLTAKGFVLRGRLRIYSFMEAPNPNKGLDSSSTDQNQKHTPNYFPNVPDCNQNNVDLIVSSFFSLLDFFSLSSPLSIVKNFEASTEDDYGKDFLTYRSLELASVIQESTKRCYRKRASLHNSNSWSLPRDLTIKVFSMLDTKYLMQVAACCTMFNKYAMDPLCYSHIDLTTGNVDSDVVHSMIHHAGKELRSLKVGRIPCPNGSAEYLLTGKVPTSLYCNHGFSGNIMISLHLYQQRLLEPHSLCSALSTCSNLTDLKIVGWCIILIDKFLELVPRKCQHLYIENDIRSGQSRLINLMPFARNCSNITSLSLIGFTLSDSEASLLIESFSKLEYFNLSRTSGFAGRFLRTVELRCSDTLLKTLILRDCVSLEERSISVFLDSLLKGHFKFIQHIDISNFFGLKHIDGRYFKPEFSLEKLKEERPCLTFVAEFTQPTCSSPSSIRFHQFEQNLELRK